MCSLPTRVVLRSSRDPANPSLAVSRLDSYLKPHSCSPSMFDDHDDLAFEVLPSPIARDECSFGILLELDESLDCVGKECAVSTVRVVEVMQGKHSRLQVYLFDC